MITEAEGMLSKGFRFKATRRLRTYTYEVITPGLHDGSEINGDPIVKVVVARLDEFDQIEKDKAHLVPQDILVEALLSKKHKFRGYRLTPSDPEYKEHNPAVQQVIDQANAILGQAKRRLGF